VDYILEDTVLKNEQYKRSLSLPSGFLPNKISPKYNLSRRWCKSKKYKSCRNMERWYEIFTL